MKKILTLAITLLCASYLSAQRDSTYFLYENLGPSVNSEFNESGPRISPDGESLYFFRTDHPDNGYESNDVWVSHIQKDSSWSKAEHLGSPINNHSDNAVHSISADKKALLVHDVYLKNGTSKSGVSITRQRADNSWSFPEALKIKHYKNTNHITSFHLSDDWETLILAIETKETYGKQDLYVSFHNKEKDTWSEPVDLGPIINSQGSEATAFLAGDQKTLYFSSNGRKNSIGGFDIYKSIRLDSTWKKWSVPENIGKPYNTADDEFYFSIPSHAGGWAYLAHSHHHGHSDIARIKKVTVHLPPPTIHVHGRILDITNENPLDGTVIFFEKESGKEVAQAKTNNEKIYNVSLKSELVYRYEVNKGGYNDTTGILDLTGILEHTDIEHDIRIRPINRQWPPIDTTKRSITLENINFDSGKWDIKDKYHEMLNDLYKFLMENPHLHYQIVGHTDSVGKEDDNQVLSENRAKSVRDFLIKLGLTPDQMQLQKPQLSAKGYGEAKPIADNNTAEGRLKNRRVELILLDQ